MANKVRRCQVNNSGISKERDNSGRAGKSVSVYVVEKKKNYLYRAMKPKSLFSPSLCVLKLAMSFCSAINLGCVE